MTAPTASPEQHLARLLWTAGVLILATLPHFQHIPLWVIVLLGVCIVWRLAAAEWGWPLPKTWWRAALAFLAFGAVFVTYRTINGLEAGSALLIVMVALKFLETRHRRDQLVLMMIAYFLVFAGLLATQGLLSMLYLISVVWAATVGFLQLSRRGPLLDARETGRLAGRLLLQALPIMVALFLLFPRLPGPLWSIPSSGTSGRTGLDSEMSFPSGHASLSAAAAVSAARMLSLSGSTRRQRTLAWSTALVAASTTAALRVAAGKHHPTDVIAGFALGAGLGWLMPTLHTTTRRLRLAPTATGLAVRVLW